MMGLVLSLELFFAFIFGIVAYDYTKRREKWKLHHDTVVRAEYLINKHLNQVSGNIHLIKKAVRTYKKGLLSVNSLKQLDNPELLTSFHNLEIIKKWNDYQSLVEMINHDLSGWNKFSEIMFSAAFSGAVSGNDFKFNIENIVALSEEMQENLEDLLEEIYDIGAYIRRFLKYDIRPRFAVLKYTERISVSGAEVSTERTVFVMESQETMQRDQKKRFIKNNLKKSS